LETSFDRIAPRGEEHMNEFYARLFVAAPEVRPLFDATDMARQKAMLLGTLVLLRKSLRSWARSSQLSAGSAPATSPTAPSRSITRSWERR
jgi:hypothetical protein